MACHSEAISRKWKRPKFSQGPIARDLQLRLLVLFCPRPEADSVPNAAIGKTNFLNQKPTAGKIFQCHISVVRVSAFGKNDMASQKRHKS